MAGDWLKVEKDTPEKPEVFALSEKLNVSLGDAFLACFRLWRWADTHTSDGTLPKINAPVLDNLVRLPGFAQALAEVGWLNFRTGAIQLPNFGRHMGQSAKKRLDGAERQRRFRSRSSNADVTQRDAIPRPMRREVLARDDNTCVYCGFKEGTKPPAGPYVGVVISLDHVIPVTQGGATSPLNLVASCTLCNNTKNGKTPTEAGMPWPVDVMGKRYGSVTTALPEKRREEKIGEVSPNPSAADTGGASGKVKKVRQADPLFDAVVKVTGSDPKASGSYIGRVCKCLREAEPPYTADDVLALPALLHPCGFSLPLTLGSVEKYIGRVRSGPVTPPPARASTNGQLTPEQMAVKVAAGLAANIAKEKPT